MIIGLLDDNIWCNVGHSNQNYNLFGLYCPLVVNLEGLKNGEDLNHGHCKLRTQLQFSVLFKPENILVHISLSLSK